MVVSNMATIAQFDVGNTKIGDPMALGGPPRGGWPRILFNIADGRGRCEGCQKTGSQEEASFDNSLLTTLLATAIRRYFPAYPSEQTM